MNRSLQCLLRDAWPPEVWPGVAADLGIAPDGFEAMLDYPDAITGRLLAQAARALAMSEAALLEDLGAYLAGRESLRRLLRFGGSTFPDFLLSLEDLPDRVTLALPDLRLPGIAVTQTGEARYRLRLSDGPPPQAGACTALPTEAPSTEGSSTEARSTQAPSAIALSPASLSIAGTGSTLHSACAMVPPSLVTPVLAGLLRAMADDYGALVLIEIADPRAFEISLDLLEDRYAPGRGFRLAAG